MYTAIYGNLDVACKTALEQVEHTRYLEPPPKQIALGVLSDRDIKSRRQEN